MSEKNEDKEDTEPTVSLAFGIMMALYMFFVGLGLAYMLLQAAKGEG